MPSDPALHTANLTPPPGVPGPLIPLWFDAGHLLPTAYTVFQLPSIYLFAHTRTVCTSDISRISDVRCRYTGVCTHITRFAQLVLIL
jgi:hypothetical protein